MSDFTCVAFHCGFQRCPRVGGDKTLAKPPPSLQLLSSSLILSHLFLNVSLHPHTYIARVLGSPANARVIKDVLSHPSALGGQGGSTVGIQSPPACWEVTV